MTPDERRQAWYRLNGNREGRRAADAAHQCYEGNPVGDVEAGNAYVRARLAAHFGRLALGEVVANDRAELAVRMTGNAGQTSWVITQACAEHATVDEDKHRRDTLKQFSQYDMDIVTKPLHQKVERLLSRLHAVEQERCVEHPTGDHQLVCLTCMDASLGPPVPACPQCGCHNPDFVEEAGFVCQNGNCARIFPQPTYYRQVITQP